MNFVLLYRSDYSQSTVVVWCDVLGGVHTREDPLPWSGPLFCHHVPGGRRETS